MNGRCVPLAEVVQAQAETIRRLQAELSTAEAAVLAAELQAISLRTRIEDLNAIAVQAVTAEMAARRESR